MSPTESVDRSPFRVTVLATGGTLEGTTVDMLGTAKKVIINKDATTIIAGAGEKDAIMGRIEQIKAQLGRIVPVHEVHDLTVDGRGRGVLTIHRSKTDQEGQGAQVAVSGLGMQALL